MEYYISNLGADGPSLYHTGRKGMKWGQHIFGKERKSSGVSKIKKVAPKKPELVAKKAFSGDRKDISKASDDELNAYLKRMQLEKQVLTMQKEMTALTTPSAPVVQKKASVGKRFVSAVWKDMLYPGIKEGMKEAGKSVVKSLADDMIKKAMEKKAAGK